MEFVSAFIGFIASFGVSEFYPLLVASSSCISSVVAFILSLFVNKFKNKDKTFLLILTIISYLTCSFKVCCDFIRGKTVNAEILCFSVFLCCVSFSFLSLSVLLSHADFSKKNKDNRLIHQFSPINQPFRFQNTDENALFKNPFKRVEFLKTEKMFTPSFQNDFGINYSQILQFINDLKTKQLSENEKDELSELECEVIKLAHVKVSDFERYEFSNKLSKLFKLMSKYA